MLSNLQRHVIILNGKLILSCIYVFNKLATMWSDALTVAKAASYAAASVIPITVFSEVIRIWQLQNFE